MILLRLVSNSEAKIESIALLLLRENLAIDVNIQRGLERVELSAGELISTKIYRLTAKTKALLFSKIDERLNDEFPNNLPEVHALPIVEMDWNQAELLKLTLSDD